MYCYIVNTKGELLKNPKSFFHITTFHSDQKGQKKKNTPKNRKSCPDDSCAMLHMRHDA